MKSLVIDQKRLLASSSSALSLLEVGLENVIHLIFLEELLVLPLVPDDPGLRWMFSDALSPKDFDCSICDWEYEVSTSSRREHFLCIQSPNIEFSCTSCVSVYLVVSLCVVLLTTVSLLPACPPATDCNLES